MYFFDYSAKMYNFSLLCIVKLQICDVTDPCGDYLSIKILLLLIRKLTLLKVHWNVHGYHKTATQFHLSVSSCLSQWFVRSSHSVSQWASRFGQSVIICMSDPKSLLYFLLFLLFSLQTDHDECSGSNPVCDDNASCQNNHGSYDCFCNVGFKGDGKTCDGKMIAII